MRKGSDQTARKRRLVWAFASPTYHFVGNLMSRLNYGNKVTNVFVFYKQREARNHFNCPTLEGAELEDQVPNGTAYTHWEKRVFEVSSSVLANSYQQIILLIQYGSSQYSKLHTKMFS